MYGKLKFRRQFLIANKRVSELQNWQYQKIGRVHLFAHPDLEITKKEGLSSLVLLLGYIFDPAQPMKSNMDIISDIYLKADTFEDIILALKPYTGRYAIIYHDKSTFAILHDPLGLREIYYCTQPNKVICGSQPNLIDTFSKPKLGITQDQRILNFYRHDLKLARSGRLWVGDETYYKNVKHLMPNHHLDIISLTAKRYWPNRKLKRLDLKIAVQKSCDFLKGAMKAVTTRHNVMMAVTSGIDSRSLLAASKEVQDRIYYFINKESTHSDRSSDMRIPRKMFSKLNIPYYIHDVNNGPVDEEFKNTFLNNTFMSTELILPTIYNVYFKNHSNKINLLGVGEIGREFYGEAPRNLTGYYLARSLKLRRSQYATVQCEKWLREVRETANACNVDIMKLFLWEGLLGTWGVVGNSESDIAIEEFDPYDSHYIYETMLSIDPKYTNGSQPVFFREMFKEMWPELLEFPFNPPDTNYDRIKSILMQIGLFRNMKRILYRIEHWRFLRQFGE